MMYDYLKRLTDKVKIVTAERSEGHGVSKQKISKSTDLLIILDSSSSEGERVKELSEHMDVVIIDHHNIEEGKSAAEYTKGFINPQQDGCFYGKENPYASATLYAFKVIEMLDYKFKKLDINYYMDLVGLSILSDQMRLDVLENRYFVDSLLKNVNNVGIKALLAATKNQGKDLNATTFNFDIIPCLNTMTRYDNIKEAFRLLLDKDFKSAKKRADQMVKLNKERKQLVNELMSKYESTMINRSFIFVTDSEATAGFNGLVASKLASKYLKPTLVLKDADGFYRGSGRSYGDFKMQSFLKQCPLIEYAAGHEPAFGFGIKKENWKEFIDWVDKNYIQEEVVLKYDIELSEAELDWDSVDIIQEFDRIHGNGFPKINVRLKDVFVHERELFPQKAPNHVKVKAEGFDMLKFNEPEYGENIDSFDVIDVIGTVGINEWNGNRKIQVFMDDYIKNSDMEMVN